MLLSKGLAKLALPVALLGGLALVLTGCLAPTGAGLPPSTLVPQPLGITVEGDGKAEAKPDRVEVRLALQAQGPTAEEATGRISQARDALLKRLSDLGLDTKDVTQLPFNIWEGGFGPATPMPSPTPSQWRAFNTVSVTVALAPKGQELAAELVAAGVPNIQNIAYLKDKVEARFTLDAAGGSAAEAQAEVSRKADSLQRALAAKGLKVVEMKVTQAGLSPVPPQAGGTSGRNYVARLIMSLSTGRLELVPQIAEAVAPVGTVEALVFGISDPQALLSRAREAALADARRKAEDIASRTGGKLERVINVVEVYSQLPPSLGTPFVPQVPLPSVALTRMMGQTAEVSVRLRVTYSFR